MTAAEQDGIETARPHLRPRKRGLVGRVLYHFGVGSACFSIRPEDQPNERNTTEEWHEAPQIQTSTGDHDRVTLRRLPIGRGEGDAMTEPREHAPTHGD